MTTTHNGLGISPVLLQAIAQTLTASSAATSSKDSVTHSQPNSQASTISSHSLSAKLRKPPEMASGSNEKDSSRVVSQLLQKLNEPVASLLAQTGDTTHAIDSGLVQNTSDANQSIITQAGLSMLGINQAQCDSEMMQSTSSLLYASEPHTQGQRPTMSISGEELNNFLMKEEPLEEETSSIQSSSHILKSQTVNTDVSSVLSALASQHVRQSSLGKGGEQQFQNHRLKETILGTTSPSSIDTSSPLQSSRTQPQIIIYGLQYNNNNGLEGSMQSEGNNIVVTEAEGNSSDVSAAYRVLLQSSKDSSLQNESLTGSSGIEAAFGLSMAGATQPVSDMQNSQEGMSQPCPICGDKVSGYHYGIFTCESCKGFFKRTVQNKKSFICAKSGDCNINSINRKKCPACRFRRCLQMGMKLEAIRQDRTRGGRSSYEGCGSHLKNRSPSSMKKMKRVPSLGEINPSGPSNADDGSKSHRNLVAILNHNLHKQTTPHTDSPPIPELLRDIMNLEPLLSDDDIPVDSIMESPFQDQALYAYMMQLAEVRLYKLVRWARNLPQFGAISTDDQILLLQNCWSELIALSLCWRSMETPNQISISSTHHITTEWAQHLGCEDVVIRLLNVADSFRKLYMDQYEYVALKVLLLITPDVKGLKEPRKIRDFQDKLMEALLSYTSTHYQSMKNKFGELLLRLPELSRLSFMGKNILLKYLPTCTTSCGLLVELLKGDSRTEQEVCVMGL